jgi:hypothetical protein
MATRRSLLACCASIAGLLVADIASACSCRAPKGSHSSRVKREFRSASVVFSARVMRVVSFAASDSPAPNAELLVLEVWKGSLTAGQTIAVIAFDDGASCNRGAESGQELMIYAYGSPPYELTDCSLTGRLADSARDRPLLDRLSRRLSKATARPPSESPNTSFERTRER